MGGQSGGKKTRGRTLPPQARRLSDDPCDLEFQVELVGVRPSAASGLGAGDALAVVLNSRGSATSVVCQTAGGDAVGTLAAFRGLAQLIGCLRAGHEYEAVVQTVSATHCSVLVGRA
jgi:hypothetical protein